MGIGASEIDSHTASTATTSKDEALADDDLADDDLADDDLADDDLAEHQSLGDNVSLRAPQDASESEWTNAPGAPGTTLDARAPFEADPLDLVGPHGQLLDLLGARLQFEQNSVRLYDALIAKVDALADKASRAAPLNTALAHSRASGSAGSRRRELHGPSRDELVEIRNTELAHVRMLDELITTLGGEPAAVTPAASREVVASRGVADVVTDPTSSLLDALEAMVLAELADHEQWVGLVELARELRRDDLARSFLTAQSTEHTHLSKMRAWISAERAASRVEVQ